MIWSVHYTPFAGADYSPIQSNRKLLMTVDKSSKGLSRTQPKNLSVTPLSQTLDLQSTSASPERNLGQQQYRKEIVRQELGARMLDHQNAKDQMRFVKPSQLYPVVCPRYDKLSGRCMRKYGYRAWMAFETRTDTRTADPDCREPDTMNFVFVVLASYFSSSFLICPFPDPLLFLPTFLFPA